tara:strand:- start:453 stop:1385 length:933 start_codon:yes stop_codon:yes gene_type:complete
MDYENSKRLDGIRMREEIVIKKENTLNEQQAQLDYLRNSLKEQKENLVQLEIKVNDKLKLLKKEEENIEKIREDNNLIQEKLKYIKEKEDKLNSKEGLINNKLIKLKELKLRNENDKVMMSKNREKYNNEIEILKKRMNDNSKKEKKFILREQDINEKEQILKDTIKEYNSKMNLLNDKLNSCEEKVKEIETDKIFIQDAKIEYERKNKENEEMSIILSERHKQINSKMEKKYTDLKKKENELNIFQQEIEKNKLRVTGDIKKYEELYYNNIEKEKIIEQKENKFMNLKKNIMKKTHEYKELKKKNRKHT